MVEPLLKVRDVARLLGIGPSTVYRLAERGTIPAIKIAGTSIIRFRAERIRTLLLRWENGSGRGRRRPAGRSAARSEP